MRVGVAFSCRSVLFRKVNEQTLWVILSGVTDREGKQDSAWAGCGCRGTDRGQGQLFKRTLTNSKVNRALTLVPAIG